jgi:hypothetical protein
MVFIAHITIALVLVVTGALVSVFHWVSPELNQGSFLAGTLSAQLWVFCWALILRSRRVPRFDMVVASELLIALGIFSLITGIVVSGVAILRDVSGLIGSQLRTALVPFGEGLLASGLAPLLASILRQIEVLRYGVDDSARSDNEPDLPSLAAKVTQVAAALDDFAAAWKRSEVIVEGASTTLMASADVYARAAQQIDKALTGLAEGIERAGVRATSDIDKALTGLAQNIDATCARVPNEIDRALTGLAADIRRTSARMPDEIDNALTGLVEGIKIAGASMPREIEKALTGLAGEIKTAGVRVVGELDSTSSGLSDLLDRAKNGLSSFQDRAEKGLNELNGKTNATASALQDLTTKTRAFSNAATEGTTLLTGLQKLIESVTNFIRPGDARTS